MRPVSTKPARAHGVPKIHKTFEALPPISRLIRAVAYRWIIRWLCGYMGWGDTRPLPACIYHNIRTRYQTGNATGYTNATN